MEPRKISLWGASAKQTVAGNSYNLPKIIQLSYRFILNPFEQKYGTHREFSKLEK
jgi:hypothetical protein